MRVCVCVCLCIYIYIHTLKSEFLDAYFRLPLLCNGGCKIFFTLRSVES